MVQCIAAVQGDASRVPAGRLGREAISSFLLSPTDHRVEKLGYAMTTTAGRFDLDHLETALDADLAPGSLTSAVQP